MSKDTVNRELAIRVLEVVDAGLTSGKGRPIPGQMCVEAAVCYAMGLPHSDEPTCVSRALRSLKISLNDSDWSSNEAASAARTASAASDAAWTASDAARTASAASDAAWTAASAASDAASDEVLSTFAEQVVQILIEMKAPGCEFLDLAPLK